MSTQAQKQMAEFYEQCQAKNYTDMTDSTQSLKAKVIATDLKLNYGNNIEKFYKKAEEAFTVVKAEREEAARVAAKLAVPGELLLTLFDGKSTSSGDSLAIEVYVRPDKSLYYTFVGRTEKTEGIPTLNISNGTMVAYSYHPGTTTFTSATVGGVTTGGFQENPGYTTTSTQKMANGFVSVVLKDGKDFMLHNIRLSESTMKRFHQHKALAEDKLASNSGYINCLDAMDSMFMDAALNAQRNGNLAGAATMLNQAAASRYIPIPRCREIADLVNDIMHLNYPPTDEELLAQANELAAASNSSSVSRAMELYEKIPNMPGVNELKEKAKARFDDLLQYEKEQAILAKEAAQKRNAELTKKVLKFGIPALAIIGLALFMFLKFGMPSIKYNNAVKEMEAGNYEAAITAFKEIDGYKDSAELLTKAETGKTLENVINQAAEGNYNQALATLSSLPTSDEVEATRNSVYACAYADAVDNLETEIKTDETLFTYITEAENCLKICPDNYRYAADMLKIAELFYDAYTDYESEATCTSAFNSIRNDISDGFKEENPFLYWGYYLSLLSRYNPVTIMEMDTMIDYLELVPDEFLEEPYAVFSSWKDILQHLQGFSKFEGVYTNKNVETETLYFYLSKANLYADISGKYDQISLVVYDFDLDLNMISFKEARFGTKSAVAFIENSTLSFDWNCSKITIKNGEFQIEGNTNIPASDVFTWTKGL